MDRPQIFCYTCAGGTASLFDTMAKDLPEAEFVKPEYAGHGTRRKDGFYSSFGELADDMYNRLREAYSGGKYALLGYSMGAIALAEVLRRILRDREIPLPVHVFPAAHAPHTYAGMAGYGPEETDGQVKERTIRFGAIPEKLAGNASFWRVYLPLYRADYTLIGKYRFEDLNMRTEIPATVFYSETDTPRAEMEKWRAVFTGECGFARFEGNHFFIREHHAEMARMIRAGMEI